MLSVVILRTPELQLGYVADVLNQIFLVFPNYAVGMGIFQLSTNFQLSKQCHIYYNLDYFCPAFPDTVCCAKCNPKINLDIYQRSFDHEVT